MTALLAIACLSSTTTYTKYLFPFPFLLLLPTLFLWQDHEAMLRAREDVERQLEEQKLALEQQQKRYEEMRERHKEELEQIRAAGHDSLAIIVEEYKVDLTA